MRGTCGNRIHVDQVQGQAAVSLYQAGPATWNIMMELVCLLCLHGKKKHFYFEFSTFEIPPQFHSGKGMAIIAPLAIRRQKFMVIRLQSLTNICWFCIRRLLLRNPLASEKMFIFEFSLNLDPPSLRSGLGNLLHRFNPNRLSGASGQRNFFHWKL